jgi:hypothetical protein
MKTFLVVAAVLASFAYVLQAQTVPSEAQIKADVMNPGVIEIIFRGGGSFDKFVENGAVVNEYYRAITVRRKTDKPGVTVDVIGDVVYRLIGSKYVYRTMRLSGNTYSGLKNPTAAEIDTALATADFSQLDNGHNILAEIESLKISPDPMWVWESQTSVSVNLIAVFKCKYSGGSYVTGEQPHQTVPGMVTVDHVESLLRVRMYRKGENLPWDGVMVRRYGKSVTVPNSKHEQIRPEKLLDRKEIPLADFNRMPKATKFPVISK